MVNTEVVQRKIVFLPGEIYPPLTRNSVVGTLSAKACDNKVEVSQRREAALCSERSLGSVTENDCQLYVHNSATEQQRTQARD